MLKNTHFEKFKITDIYTICKVIKTKDAVRDY